MSLSVTEQERLATLDECISTCEEAVGLLSAVASPGTKDKLPARERAKVDAACAYTANALYFAYMNTQGVDPKGHPVMEQLRLVKEMQSKISQRVRAASPAACPPPHTLTRCPRAACGERHQDSGGTGSGNAPQRSLALDREAAARLVRHAQGSGRQGGGARS